MGPDADGAGPPSHRDARTDRRTAGETLAGDSSERPDRPGRRPGAGDPTHWALAADALDRRPSGEAPRPGTDRPDRTVSPAALYLTRIAYLEARVDGLEATVTDLEGEIEDLEAAVDVAERDRQFVIDRYERLLRDARRDAESAPSGAAAGDDTLRETVASLLK